MRFRRTVHVISARTRLRTTYSRRSFVASSTRRTTPAPPPLHRRRGGVFGWETGHMVVERFMREHWKWECNDCQRRANPAQRQPSANGGVDRRMWPGRRRRGGWQRRRCLWRRQRNTRRENPAQYIPSAKGGDIDGRDEDYGGEVAGRSCGGRDGCCGCCCFYM